MNAVLRPGDFQHRPMAVGDLDGVLAIELRCYSHPWTRGNFVDSLAAGYLAELRLAGDGTLIGYYVAMPGFEETHLLNLSVAPRHQRQGHAWAMLEHLRDGARARGDQALWLEVRQSNRSARRLYERFGFAQAGVRRNYYPATGGRREDAVLMNLVMKTGAGTGAGMDDAVE